MSTHARTAAATAFTAGAGLTAAALLRRRGAGPATGAGGERPAGAGDVRPPERPAGRSRTLTTADGSALHVDEHGATGSTSTVPTVVLMHGYVQSSRLWAGQVEDLLTARPDLRVVTYDHRGHGRSGRATRETATIAQLSDDLVEVLDAVAPEGPVVLVGHSMGGMTITALAERRPEMFGQRVVGTAFVSTSSGDLRGVTYGWPRLAAKAFKLATPVLNEQALRRERRGHPRTIAPGTTSFIFGSGPDGEQVRETLEDMADCSAETVAFFNATFLEHDRRAALTALAGLPAAVLVGSRDRLCPPAHARTIAAELPGSTLAVFPGAGHMLQLERRPEVSRHLVTLMAKALPHHADAGLPVDAMHQPGSGVRHS